MRYGANTRGLLRRRFVTVGRRHLIGKEANELDERDAGLRHSIDEVVAGFDDGAPSEGFLAALRAVPTTELVRATGRDRSTVKRWKSGESRPRSREAASLRRYLDSSVILRCQHGVAPERGELHPRARGILVNARDSLRAVASEALAFYTIFGGHRHGTGSGSSIPPLKTTPKVAMPAQAVAGP